MLKKKCLQRSYGSSIIAMAGTAGLCPPVGGVSKMTTYAINYNTA